MRRLRRDRVSAWLGILAVAFYLWLPGHFAGHIAHTALDLLAALDAGRPSAQPHHAHHPADHNQHHGGTCPVCAAAAASAAPAAAMLPILALLPAPRATVSASGTAEASLALKPTSRTPYAPRGPPPPA